MRVMLTQNVINVVKSKNMDPIEHMTQFAFTVHFFKFQKLVQIFLKHSQRAFV